MHTVDWLVMFIPLAIVILIAAKTYGYTRSVADFMAANRVAGRYLLTNATGEASGGVIGPVSGFEVILVAGFTVTWWGLVSTPVGLLITLTGFVAYRYREARVLSMAQFFELRYSKAFRIFAGMLCFIAGIVNFGIFPVTGARFFLYFCGLPQAVAIGGHAIPTLPIMMVIFLSVAIFITTSGGMLTVMVVDCVEGLITGLFYLIVIAALLCMFQWRQISEAMSAAPAGKSLLNPFDTGQIKDFNIWYVMIGILIGIYSTGSWQGQAGFRAAASSPHEAKMAGILSSWRSYAKGVMLVLLGVCAFTYLTHPDFAGGARHVQDYLAKIAEPQIREQMRVPVALAFLLPVGIKGVLAAIMLFAMMAGDGIYMHSWGSIFIQDVILPFRKKPFEPKEHLILLRCAIIGVGIFALIFGLSYKQTDYILMFFALTGAIFSGAGAAILGGLYWKKGTTPAAWASLITGSTIAVGSIIVKQGSVWSGSLAPWLLAHFPDNACLKAHQGQFPINGQWMAFFAMGMAVAIYVIVSLLTCREDFNLDRMLHRGKYAIGAKPGESPATAQRKFTWGSLIGIDREFTLGDKFISGSLFAWNMFWFAVFLIGTVWNLVSPWPLRWWSSYWHISAVLMPLAVGIATTVWFTWGGIVDLRKAFKALKTVSRDARDDGMVVNHHNLDEVDREPGARTPSDGAVAAGSASQPK